MDDNVFDFVSIGGGAAGFFGALSAKAACPTARVAILERTGGLLGKVRISGGGRCNVTHSCFDPKALVQNYPRGSKSLLGPFTRFQPLDTIDWFGKRGVVLKTEEDGRMFPTTDSSQTIIDCLMEEAKHLGVEIRLKQHIVSIVFADGHFIITMAPGSESPPILSKKVLLATGSHPQGHQFAKAFGHTVQELVPSLFTFNIPTSPLHDLAGIAVPQATVSLVDAPFTQTGPLLITHWGFSGPAVLKLSAFGARWLHDHDYKATVKINWIPQMSREAVMAALRTWRQGHAAQAVATGNPFAFPKSLWKRFVELAGIDSKKRMCDVSNEALAALSQKLTADTYALDGKTTYKEEFVTCGGITLDEVNFKAMESRLRPGLHFAGEILDIDGITGGFNFQNAWTTGWLAGQA
jgi:predicted Rossmann fold flavoprotein